MLFEVYRCVQLNRWYLVCGCVLQRGEGWCVGMDGTFNGSKLGEGATCFSREGQFGRGDLRGVLMYEFVMVAL